MNIIWHQESNHYLKICMLQVHSCVSFSITTSIYSCVPGCKHSGMVLEQINITTSSFLFKETCYKKKFSPNSVPCVKNVATIAKAIFPEPETLRLERLYNWYEALLAIKHIRACKADKSTSERCNLYYCVCVRLLHSNLQC